MSHHPVRAGHHGSQCIYIYIILQREKSFASYPYEQVCYVTLVTSVLLSPVLGRMVGPAQLARDPGIGLNTLRG